ncbi:MAG: glycosyltransferase [Magnetococcales bacterium]|nr:glycosyltransferase [Magnetococcales bacterium]
MSKRVLLIAFHFPPVRGASGMQRTLKFSKHLPDFGWEPLVLTANPRAYLQTGTEQLGEIAPETIVKRAFALDSARHLSILGKYPRFLAWPDRWSSWWLGGVISGLGMIRRFRPQVIWSSHPIATAHLIGHTLHRLSGIPWMADFRDPMHSPAYPEDPTVRRAYQWIEEKAVRNSTRSVVVTPGMGRLFRTRYPELDPGRFTVIPNGYEESDFPPGLDAEIPEKKPTDPLVLLHSGHLYPNHVHRDPGPFLAALLILQKQGIIGSKTSPDGTTQGLRVILRGSGHEGMLQALVEKMGIDDMVRIEPLIPYREALAEMLRVDGLLLFQGPDLSTQIPAKLFEYFRVQRPILALTGPGGDTSDLMARAGLEPLAEMGDRKGIVRGLPVALDAIRQGGYPIISREEAQRHSRHARCRELAKTLDEMIS